MTASSHSFPIPMVLQQTEQLERMHLALVGVELGFWDWWEGASEIVFATDWCELVGLGHADLRMTPQEWVAGHVHPDDKEQASDFFAKIFQGEQDYATEVLRVRHASQHWVHVQMRGRTLLKGGHGKPAHIMGCATNVTRYVEEGEKLQRMTGLLEESLGSLRRLGEILEKSTDYVATFTCDNRFSFGNPSFLNRFGHVVGDLSGAENHIELIFDEKSRKTAMEIALPHALLSGSWQGELDLLGEKGATFPASVLILTHEDPKTGSALFFSFSMRDLSEEYRRKEMLRLAQVKAESSARLASLGEMASGIAHEVNNPLAIIGGIAQQTRQACESGSASRDMVMKNAVRIELSVMRIAKIIKSLRNFAREADNDPVEILVAQKLVEEVMDLCTARYKASGVKFILDVEDPNLLVKCRRVQVEQILLHLFNNAYDAVAQIQPKWIAIHVCSGEGEVRFEIQDSGPGVPEDVREKIFQPFFTTKEIGKGTGLGLSLSMGLARSNGGQLSLNTACESTCFVLTLPKAG